MPFNAIRENKILAKISEFTVYVKRSIDPKSAFVPPSGADTSLSFYIDSVSNEILQNDKYIFTSNLSSK